MPIEQSKVGEVAAELMDILETTYEEDAEISAVMLITAVNHDDGTKTTVLFSEYCPFGVFEADEQAAQTGGVETGS